MKKRILLLLLIGIVLISSCRGRLLAPRENDPYGEDEREFTSSNN